MADVTVDLESKNSKDLLNQGMRAFVLQDFQTAVQALGKASEILVAEHGDELHESLGEVYLYYGKALVGLSRQEAEPLGDAIPKGEDEESEEEEDENAEAENDANEEKADEAEKNGDEKGDVAEKNGDEKGDVDEKEGEAEENGESSTNGKSGELEESTATQDGDAADPTDLQVAWEVLELAKKIFEKNGADGKKQLAETLTTLGEISLETEHFEEAIVDIKDGLAIQVEIFPKDSRKVAETYYNLGIAYSTNTQFDEGIDAFNKSLEYLNNRVKVLEESKDSGTEDEIKEIKELIPELMEKIADMKSCKEETVKSLTEIAKQVQSAEKKPDGPSSSSSATKASDISHLVKRKRKTEENDVENPPKKVSL